MEWSPPSSSVLGISQARILEWLLFPSPGEFPNRGTEPANSLFNHSVVSNSLWFHGLQHARPPCPSPTPRVYSLMSIESVMPSNHLILCCPLLFLPSVFRSSGGFPYESFIPIKCQIIEVAALALVRPMNIQDWFPLDELVGSPCCPRDSQESLVLPMNIQDWFPLDELVGSPCCPRDS